MHGWFTIGDVSESKALAQNILYEQEGEIQWNESSTSSAGLL